MSALTEKVARERERFWSKVVGSETGCWEWTAGTYGDGYGCFYLHGKNHRAHRVSYEWAQGDIPEGLVVDHICRNTLCVRPAHLRAVTQRDNLLNGPTIIARQLIRSECRTGHPLSGDNLRITKEGWRRCMECQRAVWRRKDARRRARRRAIAEGK